MTLSVTATLYERDVMTLAVTKTVELHQLLLNTAIRPADILVGRNNSLSAICCLLFLACPVS